MGLLRNVNDSNTTDQGDEVLPERTTRRLGRPPLSPGEVRSNRVVTFVTDAQLTALQNLARQKNTSLSGACFLILDATLSMNTGPTVKKR
jgi:hypothetical protein